MQTLTFNKLWHHLRTVQTHRKWVRRYCWYAGIKWRGLKHDLSKYSPVEFLESARYWTGTGSPINVAKKEQGISYAWLHHKGRNTHHYEYWMDDFDKGGNPRLMPCNDFVEMVCDMIGASVAYNHKDHSHIFRNCRKYWADHQARGCAMNLQNRIMMDIIWSDLAFAEENWESGKATNPIHLIKSHYIQQVWRANSEEIRDDDQRLYRWKRD